MEKRRLGTSDLDVSVITFGAWAIGGWMWGGADRNEAIEAIKASVEHGVTSIDTAPAYGQGLSEEITGEAIRDLDRSKIQLLTKYGLRWDTPKGEFFFSSMDNNNRPINMHKYASRESIMMECEDSLRRLGTDYIDLYQIHWPDNTTPISETMEAMIRLIEQGKVRAAGVCNYSVTQMKEAEKTIPLASNQVPYSMLYRDIEHELVPYTIQNNKAIIVYSPLQRGVLAGKFRKGHKFNDGDTREGSLFYTDDNILRINAFLDELRPLADSKKATVGQLVIKWTIEQPGITVALVGARNAKQAIENAMAAKIQLSENELAFINNRLNNLVLVNEVHTSN